MRTPPASPLCSSLRPAPANSTITRPAAARAAPARLASLLEPAAGAGELDDHALGSRAVDACQLERGKCGGGIPPVVLAGNRELELDGIEVFGPDDVRHVREPLLEQHLDLCD